MTTIEVLRLARNEIQSLRSQNEKLGIRVEAIDDCLALLFARPGEKATKKGFCAPDSVFEIERELIHLEERQCKKK